MGRRSWAEQQVQDWIKAQPERADSPIDYPLSTGSWSSAYFSGLAFLSVAALAFIVTGVASSGRQVLIGCLVAAGVGALVGAGNRLTVFEDRLELRRAWRRRAVEAEEIAELTASLTLAGGLLIGALAAGYLVVVTNSGSRIRTIRLPKGSSESKEMLLVLLDLADRYGFKFSLEISPVTSELSVSCPREPATAARDRIA